ncbi:hypothetical protein [Mesobacillus foraminis]|uniref:hypothetical protein n=1 Tax=Mesobacillus foraminis TaxID=279826 RepID=UPI000EF4CFBA|nr:hypothetical protein [Mesobacillus foraminis]
MKKEYLVADELQCMFLEGSLPGIKEEIVNLVSKQLRTGDITIAELIEDYPLFKDKVIQAIERIPISN